MTGASSRAEGERERGAKREIGGLIICLMPPFAGENGRKIARGVREGARIVMGGAERGTKECVGRVERARGGAPGGRKGDEKGAIPLTFDRREC